ncbi:photosystem I P700 apoprotein A2, partial [Tanacetum coccineum]
NKEVRSVYRFRKIELGTANEKHGDGDWFGTVVEMLDISNLIIEIKTRAQFLSPNVVYGVYLVFKFCDSRNFSSKPVYVNLKYRKGHKSLHAYFATWRDEQWMMIELHRFSNQNKEVVFEFLLENFSSYYCGDAAVYVEGVEFRAIDKVKHEEIGNLKEVQQVLKSDFNVDQVQRLPTNFEEIYKICRNYDELLWLGEVKGKKLLVLSAKAALYKFSNVDIVTLKPPAQSRFQEVIELLPQQVFHLKCTIKSQMLSPVTEYVCYLVFKLSEKCQGLHCPVKVQDVLHKENSEAEFVYFITPSPLNTNDITRVPKQREDGWMEIQVWKFNSTHEFKDGSLSMNIKFTRHEGNMSGLIVCGLEFRPVNLLYQCPWNLYAQNPDSTQNPDSSSHIFGTSQVILTLLEGFHPQTQSLWLTDMAHHHLAIAFIFLIAGHMYRTNFGIGHSMKDLLDAHIPPGGRLGRGHKGLYDTINNSLHFQLGLALASLGVITSLVAQHMYSLPAYAFIAQDFTTQAALYTHHQYIAGFIMTGAFAHGAIFFIRDYNPEQNEDNVLARMLEHKEAIISHLSWASLFLGFHTLGLYVHNDVMLAFGTPEKQILIEPIFAQWIQSAHGKTSYGFDILLSSTNGPAFNAGRSIWLPGWLNAINENSNSLFLTIGPGDFLVHHAIALGLHTTTLILVKGALDARGSKLMPDKKDFGYSFPCDGPGRGGTCDISAWDAFYLAVFWMLNTIGWVTFYWHWKHITLWQGNVSQFNESSTYLMGWLRDYLWLNSSQLINGYNPFGMNSLSVWAWMFLFGHLVWATGFMFLISWRGYWQELIETLAWAHERTPLANLIRWRDKPVALSIVQARLVGLAHFSVGYIFTYAAFLIASTSGKFG